MPKKVVVWAVSVQLPSSLPGLMASLRDFLDPPPLSLRPQVFVPFSLFVPRTANKKGPPSSFSPRPQTGLDVRSRSSHTPTRNRKYIRSALVKLGRRGGGGGGQKQSLSFSRKGCWCVLCKSWERGKKIKVAEYCLQGVLQQKSWI